MLKPVRALFIEDLQPDAERLAAELRASGLDVEVSRVETLDAMARALDGQAWDVILSGPAGREFDAGSALAVLGNSGLDVPFIVVSAATPADFAAFAAVIQHEMRKAALRRQHNDLREQVMVADRMALIGTLAGGAVHEINNPLASLMANLNLASQTIEDMSAAGAGSSELVELADEIADAREAAERIRSIVRELKVFSRPSVRRPGLVVVKRVMEATLRVAWTEIRHRAQLVKRYGDPPEIEATESQLGQVFLSLIVAAAQEIPEGRSQTNEIRISTGVDALGRAVIEIADIVQPTSGEAHAPTLAAMPAREGLTSARRIVADAGGFIEVTGGPGRGTTYRVVLPPGRSPVAGEAAGLPPRTPPGRRGKVLVVDDEPLMMRAADRALSTAHDIVRAHSADEALALIHRGEKFDVILCDLMMPDKTGMELHAELSLFAPEDAARMIFVTGGAFTPSARKFLDETSNQRLEKPFDVAQLRALVDDRIR